MVRLPLHRPNARVHKEQPAPHLHTFPASLGITQLVLSIIPVNKVLHDTAALKHPDSLPVSEPVSKSRDAAVGVDIQEPLFFLRVLGDVDLGVLVRQPEQRKDTISS